MAFKVNCDAVGDVSVPHRVFHRRGQWSTAFQETLLFIPALARLVTYSEPRPSRGLVGSSPIVVWFAI